MKQCPHCLEFKPITEFGIRKKSGYIKSWCKKCHAKSELNRNHVTGKKKPMSDAKDSSSYLGCYIAERVLSHYFEDITRMPYGNPGYDFICRNGYKIDVKSACRKIRDKHSPNWGFGIKKNQIADFFLCIAFSESRESLLPLHIWLIPKLIAGGKHGVCITETPAGLSKWAAYEKPVESAIRCFNELMGHGPIPDDVKV